jgi:signal transduction histidine kinase
LAQHGAEAANRAKTDFVSALGHELRAPLQAITGFTELLSTLDLDDDRRTAALSHITSAAEHILTMVNDVLDVARIEARALPLSITEVALEPVGGRGARHGGTAGRRRAVGLQAAGVVPVWVSADERRVRQVLLNLVTNAIRYNRPSGGTVLVGWTVADGLVRITVRDTGPGIAAEHFDRLFTPFDRLGQDSEQGIGFGLPLARGLTEAMGGTLEVTSTVGDGTTVTVRLPLSSR